VLYITISHLYRIIYCRVFSRLPVFRTLVQINILQKQGVQILIVFEKKLLEC